MTEKKLILRADPLMKFTGITHELKGTNKYGQPNYAEAKKYLFDKNGRFEATDEALEDLKPFIKNGMITVIELDEVDDSPEISEMTKAELIAELEHQGINKIKDKPLASSNKDVLRAYLEEVYYQKSTED